MRVLVDANVIFSAILFPEGAAAPAFASVVVDHQLVLSDYTINELREVFEREFPDKVRALHSFIDALTYEQVTWPTPLDPKEYPDLRDPDDLPVLASAKRAACDYLRTGDKDLLVLALIRPRIVSPSKFIELTGRPSHGPE